MADTPTPRSYPQTLGDMFDAFLSKQGIRSLRAGGPIVSLLEAAAQSDLRNSQDIFNLLTSADLDNATGLALSRIGRTERVPKLEITPSSGVVTISDTSFTKKSSRLFQGSPAPIVGSVVLNVVDASLFPASGNVYIGRGTSSYEGPIHYTSKTNVGNHWELNLSTGTTKFHNTSETVTLAQGGNRVVGANTVVRTPQASVSNAIEFRTLFQVNLPDGETEVSNVQVMAQSSGQVGNVIAGAISEFGTAPFTGAAVTNPRPFTNGRETESDDDYRERIRAVRASRQLATKLAIETAVTGITAFDENKRVNSASLVKRFGFPATLYIDDGTGYEERTASVSIESLMDDAVGGETHFETTNRPIARAFAITTNVAPFVLRATDKLSVKVGGVTYTHSFDASSFHSISNASAFEVVASINSNPDIAFVARTAEQGSRVAVFANSDVNEDVEVVENIDGTNGNDGLQFPAGINYTMRLYKNDRLLFKDGKTASVQSLSFAQWDTVSGTQTLSVSVDHTPTITVSFTDQDFIDANTGYATVGRNSLAAWAAVINAKVPGVTATVNSGRLALTSNAGPVEKAGVEVAGGTLVAAHFFDLVSDAGARRDYTLDRNEAQVVLAQILGAGDSLTAGSFATRAFVESGDVGVVTLAANAGLWWIVDGSATVVPHGVTPLTSFNITVTKTLDWGNVLQIDAGASSVFGDVRAQDWMVLWDSAVPPSLQGVHRVLDATNTTVTVERHTSLTSRAGHRSVLVPGVGATVGKVLTTGGGFGVRAVISPSESPGSTLKTAELYDHNTKTTTPTAPMNVPRMFHTATTLANGKVVVVAGVNDLGYLTSIETYDPVGDAWAISGVSLTTSRRDHTATLLTDGRILIAGGDQGGGGLNTYQIYDPTGDTISAPATMVKHRSKHCAVKLDDDTVLIAGGFDAGGTDLFDCEIFTPGPDTTAATGSMNINRSGFGMAAVGTPAILKVIAIGNHFLAAGNGSYETYDPGAGTWTGPTSTGNLRWENKPVLYLTNGDAAGVDGWDVTTPTSQNGFKYDGTTFTVTNSQPASAADLGGPRWDSEYVELKSGDGTTVKNLIASIGGDWDHSSSWGFQSTSVLNIYDEAGGSWSVPDPGTATALSLPDIGIAFARSDGLVQSTTVPAGTNYTPSSIVNILNAALDGGTASVYKTTKFRVRTNTFSIDGDIALVTENVSANALLLEPGDAVHNLTSHLGAVQSRSSDLGTPSFEDVRVVSQEAGIPHSKPVLTSTFVDVDYTLVGLRNWWRGADDTSSFHPTTYTNKRSNSNFQFRTRITSFLNTFSVSAAETRLAPTQPWGPWDRAYFAAPYATSPNGNLEVLVDDSNDKRYSINMWRKLTTVGNVYATTNDFKDGDAAGASLATTFGLFYDFNEFAVFMSARAVAFVGDANRKHIFRYFRLGPDGNGVRVRYGNPDTPSTDLQVKTVVENTSTIDVTTKLRSGALRAVTAHNTTRVGFAPTNISVGNTATIVKVLNLAVATAQRTANVDTLTLTLPATITDHGLQVGDHVWVQSTDVNFSSGLKNITARAPTTISYAEIAADAGPDANIGTVSFDNQGEATFSGSSTAVNDFFRLNGTPNLSFLRNITFQVASVPAGGHHVTVLSGDQLDGGSLTPSTTLTWEPVEVATNLQVFANNPQTVTDIVAAINALRTADAPTCPIKASVIGTGASTIVQNSPDLQDNSQFWYVLSDGVNWVKTTTLPISIVDNYTLTFKNPITGSLSADADWENEEVRIAPITTPTVVEWLNTPTVTGLWTVAAIEAADDGTRIQISTITPGSDGSVQVQGGLANNVTIPVVGVPRPLFGRSVSTIALLDGDGVSKNMWCRIENENPLPKNLVLSAGTVLNSWTADGLLSFASNILSEVLSPVQLQVQFEKQGQFIAISDIGAMSNTTFGSVSDGDWVRISLPSLTAPTLDSVSTANQGIFRVLRVAASAGGNAGTIYVENSSAIEEFSECVITVYTADSVMPGDQLVVLDDTWGAANTGVWTIRSVGDTTTTSDDPFTNLDRFVVDVSARTPVPQGVRPAIPAPGIIYAREGTPCVYVMRVHGITLNQENGNFLDIVWDKGISAASISASAGSIVEVLDKLDLPQDIVSGADGYRYDVGLLREANKVVYGDPSDAATYPGVAAADSHINIQGPLVKRIQVSVSVRVKSGLNTQDIANRVRSAVATVINQTAIGKSIAFSDIIDAARAVVGVVSVAIVSPLYSVGHDQIKVQPYEKPFVLDLTQDVQVSFLGT